MYLSGWVTSIRLGEKLSRLKKKYLPDLKILSGFQTNLFRLFQRQSFRTPPLLWQYCVSPSKHWVLLLVYCWSRWHCGRLVSIRLHIISGLFLVVSPQELVWTSSQHGSLRAVKLLTWRPKALGENSSGQGGSCFSRYALASEVCIVSTIVWSQESRSPSDCKEEGI